MVPVRLWNSGKKAAKFTFWTIPQRVLGVEHLRQGNEQLKALWQSLRYPVCPDCDQGVLVMKPESKVLDQGPDGTTRPVYEWACTHCDCHFQGGSNVAQVRAAAIEFRNQRVRDAFASKLDIGTRQAIERAHTWHSRAFFVASALTAAGFIYMLASGTVILLVVNWLAITLALWIFGMKKSYRAWQVRTGNVFVRGALWTWFKHEKWLV